MASNHSTRGARRSKARTGAQRRGALQPDKGADSEPSRYARIFAVVRRIPKGRVATYGQIADLAELPGHARQVGYALHSLGRGSGRERPVPWQRVVNARGEVSTRVEPTAELAQRQLLEREGVEFDARGRIRLAEFQWRPRRSR